jgi:hypothetical protein
MLKQREITILIEVLAKTDVLFSCPRVYSNPARCLPPKAWAGVAERRAAFPTKGVEFLAAGAVNQRKEIERQLGDLQTAGYLDVFTKTGRRSGVKLTDQGDDVARYFAAENLARDSWHLLARMAALVAAGVCRDRLIREDDLAATDYGSADAPRKLLDIEADLLPLAARGLVDDTADAQGRVWYALTDLGVKAADRPSPELATLPAYKVGFCDRHSRLVEQGILDRLEWRPLNASQVVVPVSCGIGPAKSWRELEAGSV